MLDRAKDEMEKFREIASGPSSSSFRLKFETMASVMDLKLLYK